MNAFCLAETGMPIWGAEASAFPLGGSSLSNPEKKNKVLDKKSCKPFRSCFKATMPSEDGNLSRN